MSEFKINGPFGQYAEIKLSEQPLWKSGPDADTYERELAELRATLAEREAEMGLLRTDVVNAELARQEATAALTTARAEALEEAAERLKDWDRNGAAAGAIRTLASDTKKEK